MPNELMPFVSLLTFWKIKISNIKTNISLAIKKMNKSYFMLLEHIGEKDS
jgi:hypothetical protein